MYIIYIFILLHIIIYTHVSKHTTRTTTYNNNNCIKTLHPEDHKFDVRPTNKRPPKEFRERSIILCVCDATRGVEETKRDEKTVVPFSLRLSSSSLCIVVSLVKKTIAYRPSPVPFPRKDVSLLRKYSTSHALCCPT